MDIGQVPRNIHSSGYGMLVGDDTKVIARFYAKAIPNAWRSQQEGMPVYDTVEMVSIKHPGERDDLHRQVTDDIISRFPNQWAAYQENRDQTAIGMPLGVLFDAHPEVIEILRGIRISTIEQLASASEEAIRRMGMGGRGYVEKAQTALRQMTDAAPLQKAEAEVARLKDEMAAMREQINDLSARLAAPRRGRPPKNDTFEEDDAA